jgi:hypothetical protein
VFPHQPSTSDPNDHPDFTVPMPGYDYTPWKWVPPADPVAPLDKSAPAASGGRLRRTEFIPFQARTD